ncbi:hypothetical protein [Spirosoma flavum]|uniref:Efflux RND transporter permease subunit n=1 Tax=Spirosoma flavum TaxID=2048557 RepID=A0ABW6AL32_9BACT
MLTGVMLGLFIVPVLFVIFQGIQEKIRRPKTAEERKALAEDAFANNPITHN